VPIAVITFSFDPLLRLPGDLVVRWQTVALAAVVLVALLAGAALARRAGLRADDLLSIAVGAVPGAVLAGRLGYAIAHPAAFAAGPGSLLDPGIPGLELGLGVVGGVLSAACVVSLLGAPMRPWTHVLALPLLIALGAGKLALILGGSGQGLPFDGTWATAFLGPGPWGSLAPALPSHPAQAYEGIGTLLVATILTLVVLTGGFRRRDGRLLLVGLAGWAIVRASASTTWRDPVAAGPLPVAGWLAVAIAIGALVAAIALTVMARRAPGGATDDGADEPSWPDPETRPRF
jgi:prolipoprotein diacylglyceryltransferase